MLSGIHVPKTQFFASTPWKHGLYKTQALKEVLKEHKQNKTRVILKFNQRISTRIQWHFVVRIPGILPVPYPNVSGERSDRSVFLGHSQVIMFQEMYK